jgi:hypothetical protein
MKPKVIGVVGDAFCSPDGRLLALVKLRSGSVVCVDFTPAEYAMEFGIDGLVKMAEALVGVNVVDRAS